MEIRGTSNYHLPSAGPLFRRVGYLHELDFQSQILRLYGRRVGDLYEYFATDEAHPFLKLPIGTLKKPLCDRQKVKVQGYLHPYRVNIYEESFVN